MAIYIKNTRFRRIAYFFPFQLLLVVAKKNHFFILFWLILFGFITRTAAVSYGIPYLFLSPEYLENVSPWAYLITGFGCGGFIMAYNISTYILNGFRFPFLATLSNPFFKFCLNNSIIPIAFVVTYLSQIYSFQINEQLVDKSEAILQMAFFLIGVILFVIISLTYFGSVNKNITKMFGLAAFDDLIHEKAIPGAIRKNLKTAVLPKKRERDWHIETYINSFNSIRLARSHKHYKRDMLISVFKQNHYMASIFEIATIISLLLLGIFRETPLLEIPAGASIFLLFTFFLMITSAIHTWLRGWSSTIFILAFIIINHFYQYNYWGVENRAYGLNYDTKKSEFSYSRLFNDDSNKKQKEQDIDSTIEILNKWRLKNSNFSIQKREKPKLVIISTSGGGLRSTFWTFYCLQYADSVLQGELLKHTQLITGSSGGLIGAAYLRELYLLQQEQKIQNIHNKFYQKNISKDILNPLALSIATNDLFLRFQKFKDGSYTYSKDRGYAFENKLNENTNNILNKRLSDYREPESKAIIPMMIFAPTIINDGRKLLISSQNISYLTQNSIRGTVSIHPLIENIEFSSFFKDQDAKKLRFTSALRMNATFPYVMPVVSLPSEPTIEIMDAGMRDNFGLETIIKYLFTFRNWISTNTSGVVIIQSRDRHKEFPIEENDPKTITGTLSTPIGSLYGNLFNMQDFTQQQLVQYASLWFESKIDFVDFEMRNDKKNRVSLSWHLTNKEKKNILESINLPENQESIRRLKKLLQVNN